MMYPSKVYQVIHKNELFFEKAYHDDINQIQKYISVIFKQKLGQITFDSNIYQSIMF